MSDKRRFVPLALRRKQKQQTKNTNEKARQLTSRHGFETVDEQALLKEEKKRELKKSQAEQAAEMGGVIRNEDLLDDLEELDFKQKLDYIMSIAKERDFIYFTREQVYKKYDELMKENERNKNTASDSEEVDNYLEELEDYVTESEEEYYDDDEVGNEENIGKQKTKVEE